MKIRRVELLKYCCQVSKVRRGGTRQTPLSPIEKSVKQSEWLACLIGPGQEIEAVLEASHLGFRGHEGHCNQVNNSKRVSR